MILQNDISSRYQERNFKYLVPFFFVRFSFHVFSVKSPHKLTTNIFNISFFFLKIPEILSLKNFSHFHHQRFLTSTPSKIFFKVNDYFLSTGFHHSDHHILIRLKSIYNFFTLSFQLGNFKSFLVFLFSSINPLS